MASKKNIIIDQGTDFSQTFFAGTNSSSRVLITDTVANTPLDLTGYTANSQFRKNFTTNTAVFLAVTFGQRANGQFTISLDRITSANTTSGRYVYDVEMTSSANNRIRVLEGEITLTPEVTKL